MKALVVILNKDNAEGLRRCLESLTKQTVKICEDFDVLVLDGASSDASLSVAEGFSRLYPCIRFAVQRKPGGTGYARVEACRYAIENGYDAVIWGDSENVYERDYVEKVLRALETHDAVGGVPIVEGGFYAHAFAWYHAMHAFLPKLAEYHIPGNNRAERVSVYRIAMYPESRRAEDYGLSLLLRKLGVRLRQRVVDAKVRVSLPENLRDVLRWQRQRAIGAAEAAKLVGCKPVDALPWLTFLFLLALAPLSKYAAMLVAAMAVTVSISLFFATKKYVARPKYRFALAPLFGIFIHSIFTVLSVIHYVKLLKAEERTSGK